MREKNRKPIANNRKRLPQFTTMNVIDGQAGLIICSSLIFYSLTIDNILNIIVLLILAGVTISALSGDNGILTNASKAKYATELSQYNEELQLFKSNKVLENMNFEGGSLISAENSLDYNTKPVEETGNIYNVIPSLEGSHFDGKLEVIKGELLLNSQDKTEIEVAQSVGVAVNPYEIIDGELISSDGNLLLMDEETGTLRLPESVTSIGEGAFANLDGLKTIIIPGTVKRIQQNAFSYNSTLETVIMEDGVEYIGNEAFKGCPNLQTVQMPNSVNTIGNEAFTSDSKLSNINISTNLKEISAYCFQSTGIENIEIPIGVSKINTSAFELCSHLENIKISETVEYISDTAFSQCPNLKNIVIDENNNNFYYNNGFLLGNNKTSIIIFLEDAIKNNTLIIPDTVTTLNGFKTTSYSQIQTIKIPASVNNIDAAFFVNNNIKEVIVDENNSTYETYKDAIYTKDGKNFVRYYGASNEVTIKDGVEVIQTYAFYNAQVKVYNVTLPNSLKAIERQAFYRKCYKKFIVRR